MCVAAAVAVPEPVAVTVAELLSTTPLVLDAVIAGIVVEGCTASATVVSLLFSRTPHTCACGTVKLLHTVTLAALAKRVQAPTKLLEYQLTSIV